MSNSTDDRQVFVVTRTSYQQCFITGDVTSFTDNEYATFDTPVEAEEYCKKNSWEWCKYEWEARDKKPESLRMW